MSTKSGTGIFVASAIWAAAIVASAYLCSMLLSIPGAAGASFFWLPCIFMVTGAIWFGPYGWIAAAIGTFIGGALAGNPIAINIGQNPIPAFFANTLLLYYLFRWMKIDLSSGQAKSADLVTSTVLVAVTIIVAMIAGYYLAPTLGIWGRVIAGLICIVGWYVLAQTTKAAFKLDENVFKAVIAVVIASVVSAAGSYGPEVGQMVGLKNIPSINMIHHYLVTDEHPAIKKLEKELPVVRDPMASAYLRQEGKGLLIGPYEKNTKCWALNGMDWKFDMELLDPELDRIEEHLNIGMNRIPQFKDVGIKKIICGPITHTPDDNFLAGPAPGLKNFWMFCGASIGIAQGGGAGKYMAQWMTYGDADINMLEFEPRRYMSWANKDYTIKKSSDQYRRMYFTPLPNESIETGRPMKTTPIYNKLKESGAMYLDSYGWEKPCWFAEKGIKEEYGFKRTNAFTYVQKECENVQNNVGILDLSTFAKYEISGKNSETFLDRLCANRIPKKDGSIVLTHMLNEKGRIQTELTITRFPNNVFYVLSSTASEIRDLDWFNHNLKKGENVNIKNVTLDYGVLVLVGPNSRKVLSQLTSQNLHNNDFPWLKGKEILINKIPVKALRVNYVGELGWELHHPMDQMGSLYDAIYEVGKKQNIINFGTYAVNSLRMEKAYRGWGSELTGEISLIEAGMSRFFNLKKKNNFIGAKALQEKAQSGVDIKIVYLEVDADNADARGNEPVYHNNKVVGVVTSGGYGFRTKKSLAFAYVKSDLGTDENLEIEIQGQRRKTKILDKVVYDPDNQKLRA